MIDFGNITIDMIIELIVVGMIVVFNAIQLWQQNRLKKKLDGAQAIIHDTSDIRRALNHDLEGMWRLQGIFTTYVGKQQEHYSSGWLHLTWNPDKKQYFALYVYSVRMAHETESLVTAICTGDSIGKENREELVLTMRINDLTTKGTLTANSNEFRMSLIPKRQKDDEIVREMISNIKFGQKGKENTIGQLTFTKS